MSGLRLSLAVLASFFILVTTSAKAQQAERACGTDAHYEMLLQEDAKFAEKRQRIEAFTRQYIESGAHDRNSSGVITIPVVFHVVYKTGAENVSTARLMDQLQVLNDDFRRLNSDTGNTRAMFKDDAADLEIEFCLASVDPSGNPTSGITRTLTTVSSFTTDDAVKFTAQGGIDAWPSSDYLNFWVCNLGSGLLGYAQFPGGPANRDGVVCLYTSLPGGSGPYSDGRTATHEVGHWLNLYHTFQGGCSGSGDQVSDTPPLASPNYGCPTTSANCSGGEAQYENYMDYVNDACMNMFTNGQKTRVDALFTGGGARVSLLSSSGCSAPADPTCSDGIQNGDETGVDCGGTECPVCPPCDDVTLTINFDEYPEETSWKVLNSSGTVLFTGGPYNGYPEGSTKTETFCLPEGCYDFIMEDSYGDGICCSYGHGSYSLADASGNVLASGSSFGAFEVTDFCITDGGSEVEVCEPPTNVDYGVTFRRAGKITWDPIDNADSYIVEARKMPLRWKTYSVTNNWKAYGLRKYGETYMFRVRAVCDNGLTSDYSEVFTYDVSTGKYGVLSNLSLYPNPAVDQLQLSYALEESAEVTYRVLDMVGQVVAFDQVYEQSGEIQRLQDVSSLVGGMYMLEVEANGDRQLFRFMVSK